MAVQQQAHEDALGGSGEGKEEGTKRTFIRFVGYRVRPLDKDNLEGGVKFLQDSLRYAGIIRDDTTRHIETEIVQVKVDHYSEERTEVYVKIP